MSFIYVSIYGVFNDTVGSSECTSPEVWMAVNNKLRSVLKEAVVD